jgi:hypothetical protein
MRNLIFAAIGFGSAGCAGAAAKADTATARDSTVVAGPPAIITTQPAAQSASAPGGKSPPSLPAQPASKTTSGASVVTKADSVQGLVSVVGTSFDKHVMVADRGAHGRVEITGSLSSVIGHVAGAEVSVAGTMSGTQLNASRFLVRSVDGQPAIDGTLKTESGALFIVTAAGTRVHIVAPPPPLVGHDGARVWVTGDPGKAVSSFGFIDPPR